MAEATSSLACAFSAQGSLTDAQVCVVPGLMHIISTHDMDNEDMAWHGLGWSLLPHTAPWLRMCRCVAEAKGLLILSHIF